MLPVFSSPDLRSCLQKTGQTALTAVLSGTAGAFFLWSLDAVTRVHFNHPWLLWCLPGIGLAVAYLYQKVGGSAEGGTGLILDEIHAPGGGVPARMAPLILLGTLATHLGGGSAGREGTALQMGGSLAGAVAKWSKIPQAHYPGLLMAGVASGFGAVFGTPWAGAVFAVEVLRHRSGRLREWPWCLGAAWLADRVCRGWGAEHALWLRTEGFPLGEVMLWGKVALAALCFGLAAKIFVIGMHFFQGALKRWVPSVLLRPVIGGLGVIGLVFACGTRDYLGLGTLSTTPGGLTLTTFLHDGTVTDGAAWAWKLGFTLMTVGSGFKGGEVTPLLFIGAALGHSLGGVLGIPPGGLAALGMVAVLGAAARTPAACLLMGVELFGPGLVLPLALSCGGAALMNQRSLYHPSLPALGKKG